MVAIRNTHRSTKDGQIKALRRTTEQTGRRVLAGFHSPASHLRVPERVSLFIQQFSGWWLRQSHHFRATVKSIANQKSRMLGEAKHSIPRSLGGAPFSLPITRAGNEDLDLMRSHTGKDGRFSTRIIGYCSEAVDRACPFMSSSTITSTNEARGRR
jgi:hypothetical protein